MGAGPVRRPPPGGAPALAEDDVFVQQVRACLERRVRGESQGYVNLMQQLRQCADPVVLARFFGALGHCVGLLAAQRTAFADLFAFVFSFDWAADDAFASSFSTLINSLVSANNYFVTPAFQMLVRAFAKDFDPGARPLPRRRRMFRLSWPCAAGFRRGRSPC